MGCGARVVGGRRARLDDDVRGLETPPYPSLADVFYLAFYPLAFVGLVLLLREHVRGLGASVWVRRSSPQWPQAALGATVLSDIVVGAVEGPAAQAATNLAYPLVDILLFGAVAGAFSLWGWRLDWRWILIGTSFVLSAVADAVFLFKTADGTYVEGTLLDTCGRRPFYCSASRPGSGPGLAARSMSKGGRSSSSRPRAGSWQPRCSPGTTSTVSTTSPSPSRWRRWSAS